MFTLEALEAGHGDALLLSFDGVDGVRRIVIDGGPSGIYRRSLEPRLEQLRQGLAPGSPLAIDLVMVSHMDDDHIRGILELMDGLEDAAAASLPPAYAIGGLWLNAFTASDFAPAGDAALFAALSASAEVRVDGVGPESAAVVASIPQAAKLSNTAAVLRIPRNADFPTPLAMAGVDRPVDVDAGNGLTLSVIGPNQDRVDKLRNKWKAYEEAKQKKAAPQIAAAAADIDRSVYNLSSIVVLAHKGDRTMLLTGDALGDDTLTFLDSAGLLTNGAMHVDVLKMPHHGSVRNVNKPGDLLERLTADHYVISADGTDDNPDIAALELLTRARGADAYTIHLTNQEARLDAFFAADRIHNRRYDVAFRAVGDLALSVELDGP